MIAEETKVVKDSDWESGKTGCVGVKPRHLCYICGNEGFIPVGQGLHRCYREVCVYRDSKGLINGELKKKICFVCGKVGETHKDIGEYKGLSLFRCANNLLCQMKLIKGVKMVYTDTGVYRYEKGAPKDQPPVMLTDRELKDLKVQELKDKMEQLKQVDHKPTALELITISLQEKYYTVTELSTKLNVLLATVKAAVPYQVRKLGYTVSIVTRADKSLEYRIENPKTEQEKVIEAKLTVVQQRAYDKLDSVGKTKEDLKEYPDVLNKLVTLGLASINETGLLYMRK